VGGKGGGEGGRDARGERERERNGREKGAHVSVVSTLLRSFFVQVLNTSRTTAYIDMGNPSSTNPPPLPSS
jgi:hypothetical protein